MPTPTPWQYKMSPKKSSALIVDSEGSTIAIVETVVNSTAHSRLEANVNHLTKCVNLHDDVRMFIESVKDMLADHPDVNTGNSKIHYLYHMARALSFKCEENKP